MCKIQVEIVYGIQYLRIQLENYSMHLPVEKYKNNKDNIIKQIACMNSNISIDQIKQIIDNIVEKFEIDTLISMMSLMKQS